VYKKAEQASGLLMKPGTNWKFVLLFISEFYIRKYMEHYLTNRIA